MSDKYICFWRIKDPYGFLSNWWVSPFVENGITFHTAEHYLMYHKAILFNDKHSAKSILIVNTPSEVKRIGRHVKNFDQKVWDENKYEIMCRGLYLKFSQNPYLLKLLLETGDAILVEASPVDVVWGVGLAVPTSSCGVDLDNCPGQNLLGKALMEVRDKLKEK